MVTHPPQSEFKSIDYVYELVDKVFGDKKKAIVHTFPCGMIYVHFYDSDTGRIADNWLYFQQLYEVDEWNRVFSGTTDWHNKKFNLDDSVAHQVVDYLTDYWLELTELNKKICDDRYKTEQTVFEKATENMLTFEELSPAHLKPERPPIQSDTTEEDGSETFLYLIESPVENKPQAKLKVKLNVSPETHAAVTEFYENGRDVQLRLVREKIYCD